MSRSVVRAIGLKNINQQMLKYLAQTVRHDQFYQPIKIMLIKSP